MAVTHVFSGVAVSVIGPAREWYTRFFGRAPDMEPHAGQVCWDVVGGGWVYVVEDAARAGRSLLALLVDDLDMRLASLAAAGIDVGAETTVAEGSVRTVEVFDPDGNRIQLAQPPAT